MNRQLLHAPAAAPQRARRAPAGTRATGHGRGAGSAGSAAPGPAAVLRLGALAGNRAVAQLLAAGQPARSMQRCGPGSDCACAESGQPEPVQRSLAPAGAPGAAALPVQRAGGVGGTGDGHDLTSPRFAGDPILEACFDDKARLGVGARGPAVAKVQQALIDLGRDLGPAGADGAYGQATARAVRTFKADEKLGFEQFGDVGPGTMGRLDQLFGPGPSPKPGPNPNPNPQPGPLPPLPPVEDDRPGRMLEGDSPFCPAPFEIEPVLASAPDVTDDLAAAAPNAITAPRRPRPRPAPVPSAPGCFAAGGHVGISSAVTCFTGKVDVTSSVQFRNVSAAGQFFPYYELRGVIQAELTRLGGVATARGDADLRNFVAEATDTKVAIHDHKDIKAKLAALKAIVDRTSSTEKAAMAKLIGPADRTFVVEGAIFASMEATDKVPPLGGFGSLNTLRELYEAVCHECGAHANRVARRLKRKGGIVSPTAGVPPVHVSLVAGPARRDRRPVGGGSMHLGDVVPQTGVAAAVAPMKKALDGGQIIHARVLSGVGYGTAPSVPAEPRARPFQLGDNPPEEHSLLVIGFDGDEFVFNDPDADVSSRHGQGFGALFFSGGRLSTAKDAGDLPVTPGGSHAGGEHRYQILTLNTV